MKIFEIDEDTIAIILDKGDKIIESLKKASDKLNISGYFNGIGATKWVELAYGDAKEGKYLIKRIEEECEILALNGNVTKNNLGETIIHAHIILGKRDYSVIGGHLVEGEISITAEIFFKKTKTTLIREKVEGTEFQLIKHIKEE